MKGQEMIDYLTFIIDPSVRKHCGPLFFVKSLDIPKGNILSNGSFGLINTGKKRLLVTCHHVWEEFKKLRKAHPELMLSICLPKENPVVPCEIDSMLIDEDKKCDLVTFDMESLASLFVSCGLDFFNVQHNPPPKLSDGDNVYLIGFPGKGREDNEDSVGFPRQGIGVNASHVGQFSYLADVSKKNMSTDFFAGISGTPCFAVGPNRPIKLVGFATGFAPNSMSMLQFTFARYIQPDGVIRYMS
jgi:hypothetical protein